MSIKSNPPAQAQQPAVKAGAVRQRLAELEAWLATPVNGASLAIFRFCVGMVMALEAYTLCVPSASTFNQVPLDTFYTGPGIKFRAPYAAFEWLPMLPPFWIHVIVGVLAVAGLCMAIGFRHRIAATAVFFSWGYLYAVESTRTYWMSYYYLELLVTFLLIWMPASRRFSVDAWLARKRGLPDTVPLWTLVLLRAQLVVTYFYAGVAKVNADWLMDGEPVRYFLSRARLLQDIGSKLSESQAQALARILHSEVLTYLLSWLGAGFDLSIGFLLLFRRTRIFGMVLILIFHCTNHFVLFSDIHWFPLVGLTTALIFLDPDWPERFWQWIRNPKWTSPDWRYFVGGGVLLAGVGAALGWNLPPTPARTEPANARQMGRWVMPFVVAWIGWQALNPLRQYLASADSRFTWEGLSFCWRLKAEVYRCMPCKVFVGDPAVLSTNASGRIQIDWTYWRGERELFRQVVPARINWAQLPEILVVREPRIGERIIYNPYSGLDTPRPERESIQRIGAIWKERYGRAPRAIRRTGSVDQLADAYGARLASKGVSVKNHEEAVDAFNQMINGENKSGVQAILWQLTPFGVKGAGAPAQPLLFIDDDVLAAAGADGLPQISRTEWKTGADTQGPEGSRQVYIGGEPLIIFAAESVFESGKLLPESYLVDSQDHPEQPVAIRWNYMTELSQETVMHVSMQPFLLRRYGRHVADLWQAEYGRWPAVYATTAVSLNGRPAQMLVDPGADLAQVQISWLGHNSWIRNLEMPRIPKAGISR